MRLRYVFDASVGLVLILVPFLAGFAGDWQARDLDIAVGLSLVGWAVVSFGYFHARHFRGEGPARG